MRNLRVILSSAIIGLLSCMQAFAAPLTIKNFEQSSFNKTYKYKETSSWALKSGGTNYSYSYPDSENTYSGIAVEIGNSADNIKRIAVSWYGKSTNSPAKLSKTKEAFLKSLINSTCSEVKADAVISFIRSQQSKNYPGGSGTMPRKKIGPSSVYAGTNGETLIVGIEK